MSAFSGAKGILLCFIFSSAKGALDGYSCPDRNGRFPDPYQCDAYFECADGLGSRKECPDGLLFSSNASFFAYPCLYPQEVNCGDRINRQPPHPTEKCPHLFGYFRLGDEYNCGQFMNCVNGRHFVFDCPEGLAFNEETLKCDWPDQVPTCNAEVFVGFSCPNIDIPGVGPPGFAAYRSPIDCQKYFVCLNGRPRKFSCGKGQAFNEFISSCDEIENVPGCALSLGATQGKRSIEENHIQPFSGQ